jgi:hypothetical protein
MNSLVSTKLHGLHALALGLGLSAPLAHAQAPRTADVVLVDAAHPNQVLWKGSANFKVGQNVLTYTPAREAPNSPHSMIKTAAWPTAALEELNQRVQSLQLKRTSELVEIEGDHKLGKLGADHKLTPTSDAEYAAQKQAYLAAEPGFREQLARIESDRNELVQSKRAYKPVPNAAGIGCWASYYGSTEKNLLNQPKISSEDAAAFFRDTDWSKFTHRIPVNAVDYSKAGAISSAKCEDGFREIRLVNKTTKKEYSMAELLARYQAQGLNKVLRKVPVIGAATRGFTPAYDWAKDAPPAPSQHTPPVPGDGQ